MSFKNLQSRLSQHASGRRSGDQFCVYVGDRLVMSKLSIDQMKGLFSGDYSLDDAIKIVRSQLSYRYLVVADDPTAVARIYFSKQKTKFVFSFFGLIDLFAILPFVIYP